MGVINQYVVVLRGPPNHYTSQRGRMHICTVSLSTDWQPDGIYMYIYIYIYMCSVLCVIFFIYLSIGIQAFPSLHMD